MSLDVYRLGRRLKEIRERAELSISAAADRAGLAKSYVARLESGEIGNPGVRTITALADALGTSLPELLDYAPPSRRDPNRRSTVATPAEDQASYEADLAGAPRAFLDFLAAEEADGRRVPSDVARVLLSLEIRGKRPVEVSDWRFLHSALLRSVRRPVQKGT
jgi:transcriptional regulator with XRE-family HTH domain